MASGSHVADVPDDIAEEADAAAQDCKKGSISMIYDVYTVYNIYIYIIYIYIYIIYIYILYYHIS